MKIASTSDQISSAVVSDSLISNSDTGIVDSVDRIMERYCKLYDNTLKFRSLFLNSGTTEYPRMKINAFFLRTPKSL